MLDKLKAIKLNFALIAFLAYSVKVLVGTPDLPDSVIMGVLAAIYGYTLYLKRFEPLRLDAKIIADVQEIKSAFSKLNMAQKLTEKPKKYF